MRHSDIFDDYAKIAEEKGLVSLADEDAPSQPGQPKESSKLKKYKKSPYPRVGSDDISTIEALYGVKPELTNKYEFNIMEAAHPKPVVIGPAYDRINALVENNIERQNIMINIVQKPNDGNLNYTKYARKELLMELVRLANDLDNSGHDELRKIADECIEEIGAEKKKFKVEAGVWDWLKEESGDIFQTVKGGGTGALVGAIIGAIVGQPILGAELGATAGGLIAAIARTAPQVRNVAYNANDTVSQISDIKEKIPAGVERTFLDNFQKELQNLSSLSTQYNNLVSSIQDAGQNSTQDSVKNAHTLTTNLLESMGKVAQFSAQFNDRVNRQVYQEYVGHSKALTPVYRLISDDIEDVQDSIKSLTTAINNLKISMSSAGNEAKSTIDKTKAEKPEEVESTENEEEPEQSLEEQPEENGVYSDVMKYLGRSPSKRELDFFQSLK